MLLWRLLAASPAFHIRKQMLATGSGPLAQRSEIRSINASAAGSSSTDMAGTPKGSRRRKLFQEDYAAPTAAAAAAAETLAVSPALPPSRGHAGTAAGSQQAASHPAPLQKQQQQQQQQPAVPWPATVQLHVYWDLDNLHPSEWLELPDLVQRLRGRLQQYGSVAAMQAFACARTLSRQVPGSTAAAESVLHAGSSNSSSSNERWGYADVLKAVQTSEPLRCPLCRRRCKSVPDLTKHFLQLHTREHTKRLKGPKYAGSDKEKRYREALQQTGLPCPKLAGMKGQAVQLLLQKGNVKLIQVPNTDQAADEAIKHNINRLLESPPILHNRVLVLISDDRGFRGQLNTFLQAGGAGVVLVTARTPVEWEVSGTAVCNVWHMVEDVCVVFVDWNDILCGWQ